MSEYIEVGQPLQFTDPNTPTRVGEIVESVSDIYDISSPRLGMQVFVKNEKKSFVITSLKNKVIGGVDVPEAAVEAFEPVGAKSITWNNDTDQSNMNDFVVAGVYDITGERTRSNDNLPITNIGDGHTFNARLTVLDSSIPGTGKNDDKCITQVLSFSNRLGQGEVYIRTGKGASLDNLTWEKWSTLQRNVNVDTVTSLDHLIDNGIYSGVYTDGSSFFETFVMVVINNYSIAGATGSVRNVSQFKYAVDVNGIISYKSRIGNGNTNITWNKWKDINEGNIKELIKTSLQGKSEESNSIYDPFKFLGDFAQSQINEFNTTLDNLTYNTNVTGFGYGYFRALFGFRNVEIANFLLSSGQNTIVQVVKGVLQIRDGKLTSTGEKYDTFIRKHSVDGWSEWVAEENKIKEWIDTEIAKVIDGAPDTLNTLKEIATWVENHEDLYATLKQLAEDNTNLINVETIRAKKEENAIKSKATHFSTLHFTTHEDKVNLGGKTIDGQNIISQNIPAATTTTAGVMSAEDKRKLEAAGSGATKIVWGGSSNMNDFKTAGVYDIYGERTRQDDNLPILNASSGHSIAARLTVVASTLQPANNEICVTQFLMLSNRLGGDGNMYIRTYNENNSPARDWWTPWQKVQGVKDGYIYTDTVQINPDGGVQQIEGVTGMCNMVDNGIYSGIYVNNTDLTKTTVLETFTLIVINDYAAVGVANQMLGQEKLQRQVCQLKYAVDAAGSSAYIKKRTFTGNGDGYKNPDNWSDWKDIGGGEVNVTDAVKNYGLPALVQQGLAKEGVTYAITVPSRDITTKKIKLDTNGKLADFFSTRYIHDGTIKIRFTYDSLGFSGNMINGAYYSDWGKFDFCIIFAGNTETVKVTADMTTL